MRLNTTPNIEWKCKVGGIKRGAAALSVGDHTPVEALGLSPLMIPALKSANLLTAGDVRSYLCGVGVAASKTIEPVTTDLADIRGIGEKSAAAILAALEPQVVPTKGPMPENWTAALAEADGAVVNVMTATKLFRDSDTCTTYTLSIKPITRDDGVWLRLRFRTLGHQTLICQRLNDGRGCARDTRFCVIPAGVVTPEPFAEEPVRDNQPKLEGE